MAEKRPLERTLLGYIKIPFFSLIFAVYPMPQMIRVHGPGAKRCLTRIASPPPEADYAARNSELGAAT